MALVRFSPPHLAGIVAALLLALPAAAQTSTAQKATAEAYFDDALRLMRSGSYSEACSKLEASQRLDPAVGTLLYLGECFEKRGRTASAWVTFRDAEALARSAGQAQRADMARVHAERLQAGLSRVTVEVSSEARALSGLSVRCGSVPIDATLPGAPVPVDPGEVIVEASAPGYATLTRSVVVPPGGKVTVSIPALSRQAVPLTPPPTAPPAAASPGPSAAPQRAAQAPAAQPPAAAKPASSAERSLVLPLALGAVGVVGLGVGSVFGVKAINNASKANDLCPGKVCSEPSGASTMDRARTQAQVSNVAFAVGVAGLAAGLVVYLLDRPKKPEQALRLAPWLSTTQAGLALGGQL